MTKKTARNGRSHERVNGKPAQGVQVPGVKVTPTAVNPGKSVAEIQAEIDRERAAKDAKPAQKAMPLKSPPSPVDLKAAGRNATAAQGATANGVKKARPEDVQKEIGPKTRITLSLPRLKAALAVAAKKDVRGALNGVFLQTTGLQLNILATDGSHLLQSCMWRDEKADAWPTYLEKGIILDREALARAVAFLGKDEDVKVTERVAFEYADNSNAGVMMDSAGDARIKIPVIDAPYPRYQQVLEQGASALMGGETTPLASTAGIAREYMKAAGVVAAALEAKAVQVVAPLDDKHPWVLVYPGCEGVMHIIMPLKIEVAIGHKTLALIGTTNLKGSMAALKATITLKTRAMEESNSDAAKVKHKAVIDSCKERMKAIEAALIDLTPRLAGPKAEKPEKAAKVPKVRKPKVTADAPKAVH